MIKKREGPVGVVLYTNFNKNDTGPQRYKLVFLHPISNIFYKIYSYLFYNNIKPLCLGSISFCVFIFSHL